MKFAKYHALGNDYLVIDPAQLSLPKDPPREMIRLICHRHFGLGSDGILLGPLPSESARFALRIFNPDGSEAEKSGNGLRIFSRYLWDQALVSEEEFAIQTAGGTVIARVTEAGRMVQVQMGQVTFSSERIPVTGAPREVLQEPITAADRSFLFSAASIGNPHCVIIVPEATPALARQYGPLLETHPFFPRRTNVQFVQILDPGNIRIEIWERGAGYTLASGSSSSAAAAVARKLGLCEPSLTVHMPGGRLAIEIGPDLSILMTGPVTKIAEGVLAPELFETNMQSGHAT